MRTLRFRAATAAISVIALTALTAACGSGSDPDSGSKETAQEAAPAENEKESGDNDKDKKDKDNAAVPKQLNFTAKTVDGKEFKGESLVGKNAVLWFWAPWCTVCAGEASTIKKTAEAHSGDVTFVGVPGKSGPADMKKFVSDHKLGGFEHAIDADGSLWSSFEVAAQPAIAFIDKTGKADVVPGTMSEADLNQRIAKLTGQ
ncbi:redoxin domain-containing protein [Streptomyces gobiensis]|uniref:redoxin domain-containing protein n=1 Tax=Streptomyces gobiensis TaxID=2875706 RepID=UPI001E4AA51D|nr:redoxin domain-containing protein [Streptomyces gobiensis]UGY91488.1 redoxin domain-containing protein [Streptomyces gobiensis]